MIGFTLRSQRESGSEALHDLWRANLAGVSQLPSGQKKCTVRAQRQQERQETELHHQEIT